MDLTIEIKGDSKFPVDRKAIRERIRLALEKLGVTEKIVVSVSIVGDRKMRTINRTYRNKDYATDVLSFPTLDPTQPMSDAGFFHPEEVGRVIGDIIVSHPQAVLIASRKNQMLDEAVCDLVEHGLLHLMGIHHD